MKNSATYSNLLIAFILSINIWCWFNVSYYQDEFVFRLITARFIQDGNPTMGIYSMCESWMAPIPFLMQLPAWVISWWYLHVDLQVARALASFSFALIIFATIWKSANFKLNLALLATTIGVAASSIGYTRPEYLHFINIAISILIIKGFWTHTSTVNLIIKITFGFILFTTFLLSIYSHSQVVLFLPLNLFAIYLLLRKQRAWLFFFILVFGYALFSGWQYKSDSISCEKSPAIHKDMSEHTNRLTDFPNLIFGGQLLNQSQLYLDKFIYKPSFQSRHLPSWTPTNFSKWINGLILFCVASTLIFSFFITFVASIKLFNKIKSHINDVKVDEKQTQQYLLVIFTLAPALLLFMVNTDQNFYRNFFIHTIISIGLVLYFQNEKVNSLMNTLQIVWVLLVCFVALSSAYINVTNIKPLLESQIDVYGANWSEVSKPTMLVNTCQLDLSKGRVFVDAYAYEAIKETPFIYPTEYVFFQSRKTQVPPKSIAETMKMQGMVYACNPEGKIRLCCKKFK